MIIQEIRSIIDRYVRGESSYSDFRHEFFPLSLDIESHQDAVAISLCSAVEYQCSDFSEDLISEVDLRQRLAVIAHGQRESSTKADVANVMYFYAINVHSGTFQIDASSSSDSPIVPYPMSTGSAPAVRAA